MCYLVKSIYKMLNPLFFIVWHQYRNNIKAAQYFFNFIFIKIKFGNSFKLPNFVFGDCFLRGSEFKIFSRLNLNEY